MQQVSSRQTLYSLQFLRFYAALLVLLYHLQLMASGYKGVDIFFVISGFVMYYSTLVAEHKGAAKFFINRLTKIYILYWLVLLLLYFVTPYKIDGGFVNTVFVLPGHRSILGVSWSLAYELYFYFLFGLCVFLFSKKYHKLIFFILLATATTIIILNTTLWSVRGSLLNFLAGQNLWEFLLGIACCAIFTRYKIAPTVAAVGAVLSLVAFTLITMAYGTPVSFIVNGILAFLVVTFATMFEKKVVFNVKAAAATKILGDASYAMYLTGPVITLMIDPETFVAKMITIVIVIVVAIAINKLIENKLLIIVRKALFKLTGAKK
jgi:exopolysaccharide production protein ExoZ